MIDREVRASRERIAITSFSTEKIFEAVEQLQVIAMGVCGSLPRGTEEEIKKNERIERQIRHDDYFESRVTKILLLGAGGSGARPF